MGTGLAAWAVMGSTFLPRFLTCPDSTPDFRLFPRIARLCQAPTNPLSFFCDQTNRTYQIVRTRRKYMAIAVGQTAPDFSLKDQYDKDVKLSEFAGRKNVVLVFYP